MITYFHRNSKVGYSIQKVFKTLTDEISKSNEIEEVYMKSKTSMPLDIIKNSYFTFLHRNITGVNHITGHIHEVVLGLIGCKTILTVHDLVFLDNVKNPIKKFYKWLFWLYLPIKLSNVVVCISEKTKNNVLKNIKTNKLIVIGNPIDPMFRYVPKKFNHEKPIVLHIGTGWNKNLKRVIEALQDISCELRIVGILKAEQLELLKNYRINYSNVFNLSDNEIVLEYRKCDIVSFPSEYEGFGMPIIEGQMTGRIVVTSNIEPLVEVGGKGVIYTDPHNTLSIRNAYLKVIKDDEFRKNKIILGQINVKRFNVEKITQEYLNLYKNILT
jgi:glycosyltransferase involved in cell wall biosynthesis